MDDRQPSAAHTNRDLFCGMPKRGLAFLLANVMFWQPMWAQADGIVVSAPGSSLGQAGNGMPIVNIAAPNGSGLSHNQFTEYNVGTNGVILNNATSRTQSTQLGGIILGNPNLNGAAAQTILNEVNGGSPSQLHGYTEVAGQSAHVIVANPYGITCNGCGFINTPQATLTTGKPIVENGQVSRYQVDQGSVTVEGAGLNATNVDRFEIITRSAKINAEIQARNLTIVAGRNDVDAATLNATARADDGSAKPQLAIDSSALGGMYAGAIKLVGTEAGVGVKLDGKLIASGGDIQLDANGHLSLADTSATGAVNVKAASANMQGAVYGANVNLQTSGALDVQQNIAARDRISLSSGGQLTNNGVIEAGVNADNTRNATGDVSLTAQNFDNSGKSVIASRNLTATVAQTLNNQGGTLSAGQVSTVKAGTLDNQNTGRVLSSNTLTVTADTLLNTQGTVSSNGNLTANVGQLNNNSGQLSSLGNITVRAASLDNSAGRLLADGTLTASISAQLLNQAGLLSSIGLLTLDAGTLDNRQGSLYAQKGLNLDLQGQLLNAKGSVRSDATATVKAAEINNDAGQLASIGALNIDSAGTLSNLGGSVISNDTLSLKAGQVNNASGRIASAKALDASVTGLDQQSGELFSNARLTLDLNQGLLNNQSGLINTSGALLLSNLKDVNNQSGEISSQQAFTVAAQNLDNRGGKLLSNQGLVLKTAQLLNNARGVISAASLDSHSANLDNSDGLISSHNQLDLTVDTLLDNQHGSVIADGALLLVADRLDNRTGSIAGKTGLEATLGAFDNRQGTLISTDALTLKASSLDNRQAGLIGATKALDLNVDDLDNRGGELTGNADVTLVSQHLDNSDGGQVNAGQMLKLTVDALLNRTKGLLSAKTGLTLDGGALDNSGGFLSSLQNQRITLSRDLINTQGQLSSEGTLNVTAANLSNTGGSLSSAADLTVQSLGSLDNQGGELVTDGALLLTSQTLDNRQQGTISGKGAVSVTTGAFNNSQKGRLNSGSTLDLKATQVTNQDGGRIGSQGALTAAVSGLDQQGGQLFSNTALTLDLNHGQLNNQGGLINAPLLVLKNLKAVNNDGGEISSAQAFTLAAQSLDNDNGKLLSNQALTLRIDNALTNLKGLIAAAALDVEAASLNNNGGTLTSRANLDLALSGPLNNQSNGLISATDALTIATSGLNNQQGSLLGSAIAIDFGAATGDLNNSAGLITTAGILDLKHLRDLNNRNGEISSSQDLTLSARDLDNSAGQLISNGVLTVGARDVINQGGLLSGFKGLGLTAASLDNRNSGTLSSRDEDIGVTLSGALLNGNAGALVGKKQLTVSAASLDNGGGILSSGGEQTLTVTGGLLNNAQGGLIDSGAALVINAMTLGNAGGTVNAQSALSFTGTNLDNTGGTLVGNAAVTLDLLGALTNTNGKLASVGPLRVERATQIDNQGGQIASQGLLTLLTAGLDNRNKGTVAANDQLILTSTGTVQNDADGLIYSQNGGVQIGAASLTNGKGTVQSQGAMTLTVTNDIDNQSGRIQAKAGDLMVVARHLDNRGGVLASLQGLLTTQLTGVLKNGYDLNNNRQGGITQAQRLNLTALGGLDNYGGRISAQTGDAIVNTRNFDNRNGGLYAKGKVSVTGNDFDNSGDNDGQIAGSQIDLDLTGALNNRLGIIESDSTLAIKAASLDNQTGQLRALGASGKTDFQIGGLFDNRNGTLETANTELSLGVGNLLNTGGSVLHVGSGNFGIATHNVINAGGSFVTRGAMTLSADSWTNSSVLQAGTLSINVNNFTQTSTGQLLASSSLIGTGGNWTNDGVIASDGGLELQLTGRYSGNGRVTSLGDMTVDAASIDLSSVASITGGGTTTIGGRGGLGSLNNDGRLTSAGALNINAGTVTNHGTIAGADGLKLTASTLLNDQGGFLFSGADMKLRVGSLTNRKSDVYALGDIDIALNDQGGRSALMENDSGTMESGRDFSINADSIINKWGEFKTEAEVYSSAIGFGCYACNALPSYGNDRQPASYYVYEQKYRVMVSGDVSSKAASLATAGNLVVKGGSFLNSNSSVSAGGNVNISVSDFENTGAALGDYVSKKYYSYDEPTYRNMADLVIYNIYNDADYNGGMHFWNAAGVESTTYTQIQGSASKPSENEYFQRFGPISINIGLLAERVRTEIKFTESKYSTGIRIELPDFIKSFTPFDQVVVSSTSSDNMVPAIIQAGGNVSITATDKVTNGVERPFSAGILASPRTATTTASGSGRTTVVTLNSQLPPDLAQQQINPLTLPGFTLPTGQNGLFRLSGQGVSDASSQTPSVSQNWTIGSANMGTSARPTGFPAANTRTLQVADATQISATNQQLQLSNGNSAGASTIPVTGASVNAPVSGQTLTRVTGLPSSTVSSKPHKYLIETNPVLTNLKQFTSSDYLLTQLGYDADTSAKRLGDGLFEQRLIQQAVTARTGQRFIDGQTTDEGLFKYLMNNAIASKDALNLSMGVTLSAQQVAALTHDIVWLEEHEVNGEKVLVPVLYMANANNRLAANGALIQGSDVTLIAGKDLNNAGTLRASNNLAATAGNDQVNSALIEAGNRLDLLAGNDIINKAGGVIAGRDVSMTAIAGDVINQRMVTGTDIRYKGENAHSEYVDSGSRIEAANDLTVKAARDFVSTGSTLQSGGDTTITAGRDAFIAAAEQHNSVVAGAKSSNVTQYGSDLTVGRDLSVQAGRDLAVVASQIEANRNIDFGAGENLTVASAADESHSYSKSKKVTIQEDHVKQISSVVSAGQDVTFNAGKDMALISSRINAGNEAYLAAVGQLDVLAAQDTDYSLYDKKKKGSWGRKQTRHDEVTKTINLGTQITTGSDLTLVSGGDQRYQVAKLESGADLTLRSGGAITFEGVKDLSQESHEKSNNSLAWNSSKGKGHTDETLRQSELISKGSLAITAAKGVHIDIKQIDQKTVSQTIDAMVQADPQLAWLKEAEQRGDVDWQRVKEVHDSFKYSNSGMGTGTMLAVVIIVTVLTAGSGTAATVGASASGAATAVGISATTAAAIGAAASAAYTAAVVQSVVSTINNKGNLGAVLKDVTSTESLKGYLTSGLAAGFASGVLDKAFGVSAENASKATHGFELASTDGLTKFVGYTLAEKGFGAVTNTAINGGSLKNNLAQASISAAADVLSASIYNRLGTQLEFTGIPAKVGAHAIVGGLIAEAAGGSFRTGALAAGANEAFVAAVGDKIFVGDMHDQLLAMTSQLIGVTVSAAAGGSDKEQEVAGWVAQQATKFNSLDHPTAERLLNELKACKSGRNCTEAKQRDLIGKFEKISAERSQLIDLCETRACVEGLKANTIAMDDPVAQELLSFYRNKVSYDMVGMLVGNPGLIAQPAQGYDPWGNTYVTDDQIITAKYIKEGWLTPAESANLKEWENKTSWLDDAAGRKLSVAERAAMISNMGNTLLTEGWGTKVVAGVGKGGKTGNGVSTDADGLGVNPGAGKGPCCFAAGTMVATPSGAKAIETLKVGDTVWSKPENGGEPFAAAILATHKRSDQPIYKLRLTSIRKDGAAESETLLVTPSHPFYVPAKHDFIPVIDLEAGDLLQSLGDGSSENVSTRVTSLELFQPQGKTYNLTVDIGHTFYVGKLKTWVHNTGPCPINTRFIEGATVVDQKTGKVYQGTVDLGPTLDRIKSGGSYPHKNDGSVFKNNGGDLPVQPAGYYKEYVHPSPGISGPGPQRIVVGKGGEMYYTSDHYKTFILIKN
ncbi:filamentous hemagglutinin N-terminal domain-containing protein [Pseudomonas sp. B21-056]|uniref:two-partner secretion domain-containing protein n=1 Tax=Pseudomonas sp. B21-056 TaxID=2895495 RepID=UPI00222F7421|nr:filamentous hemagglutinin N-terminal domain-containing protein [Pseudomonas sp. B21-056]UZE21568.1 filamentous hemagglutinin N-terminal domain-containing protein [Pseudomonas sp. B21-056]